MTFTTRELIRRAARNLLAHRDVGRSIDPMSEQWAEGVLKANPADGTFQERDASALAVPQQISQLEVS